MTKEMVHLDYLIIFLCMTSLLGIGVMVGRWMGMEQNFEYTLFSWETRTGDGGDQEIHPNERVKQRIIYNALRQGWSIHPKDNSSLYFVRPKKEDERSVEMDEQVFLEKTLVSEKCPS